MEALAQIFARKNGKTIAGIVGIVVLVVVDKIIENGYRFTGSGQNGGVAFEPAHCERTDIAKEEEERIEANREEESETI